VDLNQSLIIPNISGCFMLLRSSLISQVGGFDERFFMYCEDVDLGRRFHKVSKTVHYPHEQVYHDYEKGSYKKPKLLWYHIVSAVKYFNKHGWIWDRDRQEMNADIRAYDEVENICSREVGECKKELRYFS